MLRFSPYEGPWKDLFDANLTLFDMAMERIKVGLSLLDDLEEKTYFPPIFTFTSEAARIAERLGIDLREGTLAASRYMLLWLDWRWPMPIPMLKEDAFTIINEIVLPYAACVASELMPDPE